MPQVLAANALPPPVTWDALVAQRSFLVQFARRRALDPLLADDVVHDVFEAVMTGRARFCGRAALRTWLAGIVKHKVVDLQRERANHFSLDTCPDPHSEEPMSIETPQPGPQERAELQQTLDQTLARIAGLPPNLRHAVEMRLVYDQSSDAVCRTLAITPDNLAVRLHRARKQLMA